MEKNNQLDPLEKELYRYDKNNPCTVFVIVCNILIGFSLAALEVAELMYIWSLEILKYRKDQFTLFGESAPGFWLGFLYLVTGIVGIVARHTQRDPEKRHVRYTVFAAMNLLNVISSIAMVGLVGYTIDQLRWNYPQLCKGYPYAGTYDHYCDYDSGFWSIIGLTVPMMILYSLEAVVSFLGAVYAFTKVCDCNVKTTSEFGN